MKNYRMFTSFVLLASLFACQDSNDPSDPSSSGTLKVTFDGETRIYTDARLSEGKLGSIVTIGITAGSSESDYLSVTAFGSEAGKYPYKKDINDYTNVGQVEYKTGGTVFNNYFTQICPDKSGYYSTTGTIEITEYVAGTHAKGTFSGPLLNANSEDECRPDAKTFSGEFEITLD